MSIELLKQFCVPAGQVRDNLAKPFTIDEHTYSTDGRILVRLPGRLAEPPCPEAANVAKIAVEEMGKALFSLTAQDKNILLPKYAAPTVPCEPCAGTGLVKVVQCPSCQGQGEVELDGPYGIEYGAQCVVCEGTEVISKNDLTDWLSDKTALVRDYEAAEKVHDEKCNRCQGTGKYGIEKRITLGDKDFRQDLLAKLTGALENVKLYPYLAPGDDPTTGWAKPAYFIFDGGDGILMPMRKEV